MSLLLLASGIPMSAQKKKQHNQITRQDAIANDKKKLEQQQAKYQSSKDHHLETQDKQTRKRMKRTLKRARKHSWGKDVPWYKRWFRKGKV